MIGIVLKAISESQNRTRFTQITSYLQAVQKNHFAGVS
ncbi:hypothetical protein SPWS13_1220 [Shewanella putrefaciens]|nr:hypothetical protein SPWS13_1220 [Shewanella putrefaciens]